MQYVQSFLFEEEDSYRSLSAAPERKSSFSNRSKVVIASLAMVMCVVALASPSSQPDHHFKNATLNLHQDDGKACNSVTEILGASWGDKDVTR